MSSFVQTPCRHRDQNPFLRSMSGMDLVIHRGSNRESGYQQMVFMLIEVDLSWFDFNGSISPNSIWGHLARFALVEPQWIWGESQERHDYS